MLRLTREVRVALNAAPPVGPPHNSYAGYPELVGDGLWLRVAVTVEGEVDRDSQYLVNIVEIDRVVRERVVPWLGEERAGGRLGVGCVRGVAERLAGRFGAARVVAVEIERTPYLKWSWVIEEQSMSRVSSLFEFSASHRLHNPRLSDAENRATFGKCNNPHGHGHNYQVKVTVRAADDGTPSHLSANVSDLSANVSDLSAKVDEHLIKIYDHKHLNLEVADFADVGGVIPSVENIAKAAFGRLKPVLGGSLVSVTVWETPKTWAEYAE